MADVFNPKFGTPHRLGYYYTDSITADTNRACLSVGANAITAVPMPYSGKIIAITAKSSATVTVGTITFNPSVAGTVNTALSAVLGTTAAQTNATYATITPNSMRFTAGQVIGAMFTTTTDATPTNSNDFMVSVWVSIDPD